MLFIVVVDEWLMFFSELGLEREWKLLGFGKEQKWIGCTVFLRKLRFMRLHLDRMHSGEVRGC